MNPRSHSTTIFVTIKRDTNWLPSGSFTVSKVIAELVPHYDRIEIKKGYAVHKVGTSSAEINERIDGNIKYKYPDSVDANIYYEMNVKNDDAYQEWKKLLSEKGWIRDGFRHEVLTRNEKLDAGKG